MSKKNIMKNFLKESINFEALQNEKNNSWLKNRSAQEFSYNGIVANYFSYDLMCKAVKKANYKYPNSDRVWAIGIDVTRELVLENIK